MSTCIILGKQHLWYAIVQKFFFRKSQYLHRIWSTLTTNLVYIKSLYDVRLFNLNIYRYSVDWLLRHAYACMCIISIYKYRCFMMDLKSWNSQTIHVQNCIYIYAPYTTKNCLSPPQHTHTHNNYPHALSEPFNIFLTRTIEKKTRSLISNVE